MAMDSLGFFFSWLWRIGLFRNLWQKKSTTLHKKVMGLDFRNPVGIGAGFDKNARYLNELVHLGFGSVEIGTVTPMPQPGNPKPRLFRLPKDKALVNRMGFNNEGMDAIAGRLKRFRDLQDKGEIIIGGNIGKNKVTPNEEAVNDYLKCFRRLYDLVDYFVVNVSSPNTPDLRALQEKEPLTRILNALADANQELGNKRPILLKIAPDLSDLQLKEILDIINSTAITGIITNNTTISRDGLSTEKRKVDEIGAGGLSGNPLKARSMEMLKTIRKATDKVVISVGGIMEPEEAVERLNAGADLVQVYTGFIYQGPGFAKKICRALLREGKLKDISSHS